MLPRRRRPGIRLMVALMAGVATVLPGVFSVAPTNAGSGSLLIGEIATGGAAASDEFIELANPSAEAASLAGLELVYVSASGTASVRLSWEETAPALSSRGRYLVANADGAYAAMADALYHGGLASAGGVVVLRVQATGEAVDSVGWGTGSAGWGEGAPAAAPAAGSSLARLAAPDGTVVDTDDNAADFAVGSPTPASSVEPPPSAATATALPSDVAAPSPSPSPTATLAQDDVPTATPTPAAFATPMPTAPPVVLPSPAPTASPAPSAIPMAAARQLPDGTEATVEGVALTAADFHDGGGYLADASGGIAVILDGGSFSAGSRLRVTGLVDNRFAQRTLRTGAGGVQALGSGAAPPPVVVATGAVGEHLEGTLVRISGVIASGSSSLSNGVAIEVDDGSGAARVVVASSLGLDTAEWARGWTLELVGVVGQRDSSGSGTAGYRVQPRSGSDVLRVTPAPTPSPPPSPAPSASPAPSSSAAPPILSIREAREAPNGTELMLRGVVTLPPGIVDAETAAIQDATAAIVLRLDPALGGLAPGSLVEVEGTRSTKSGMLTLRAGSAPRVISHASVEPLFVSTGEVAEPLEARLVRVSGVLRESARRAGSGTISFQVDDGSGPIHVVLPASLAADDTALEAAVAVEVTGIVGQETTGAAPDDGYRIWARSPADVRVIAAPTGPVPRAAPVPATRRNAAAGGGASAVATENLDALEEIGLASLRVGATLVAGPWPELGIGGLLWDGAHLVALSADSASALAALGGHAPPIPVELRGLRTRGVEPLVGLPTVAMGSGPDAVVISALAPAAPHAVLPAPGGAPAWVGLVGRVQVRRGEIVLDLGGRLVALDVRCQRAPPLATGVIRATGIAIPDPPRLIVGCEGLRQAPTLERATAAAPSPTAGPAKGRTPTKWVSRAAPQPLDDPRPLAGGLLGLGVLALAVAAVAWHAISAPVAGEPAESEYRARDLSQDGSTQVTPVPQLRLVRLRRDASD